MSCDWVRCLFNPRLCLSPNEEEHVSFVMRRLVLLWCIFSQTWRNLVIHQPFLSLPPPPLHPSSHSTEHAFSTSPLDRAAAHFFFLNLISTLPAFTALKILLRAIDKMWHITFCTVYYFVSKYKRDKPF